MKVRSRKRKNGVTVFFMDYRLNGRRHQQILRAVKNKREAQEVADLLWAQMVNEQRFGEHRPETVADRCVKLGDVLDADSMRIGVSEWTIRMERSLGKHLKRLLGESTPILAITTGDIEKYKRSRSAERVRAYTEKMKDRGIMENDIPFVKPITINKELEHFRAVLNRLKKTRTITRIPCEITKLPVEKKRARALTEKELLAVLKACADHSDDMLEKTIFFTNTGFRKSEVFNARWTDLDHTQGFIRVLTKKKGTSGEYYEDLVPLNKATVGILESRRKRLKVPPGSEKLIFGVAPEDRRVYTSEKASNPPGTLGGITCHWDHCYGDKLKSCAKAAGVIWWKSLRIHHLRHSFATISLDRGANIMEVARLIRHRDPMLTVRTYLHTRDAGVIRAVNNLNFGLDLGGQAENKGTSPE